MAPLSLHLQFAEQFKEVKEAARLAREKSQERFELANPALSIAAPQVKSSCTFIKPVCVYFPGAKQKYQITCPILTNPTQTAKRLISHAASRSNQNAFVAVPNQ